MALNFQKECKPRKNGKLLNSIKNVNPKSFPTCQGVLLEQIESACFVAILYKTAGMTYPTKSYTEVDFGYQLAYGNEFLDINWFAGEEIVSEIDKTENEDQRDNETLATIRVVFQIMTNLDILHIDLWK